MPLGISVANRATQQSFTDATGHQQGSTVVLLFDSDAGISEAFRNRLLTYVGNISYEIYLLHSFVFATFLGTHQAQSVIRRGSGSYSLLVRGIHNCPSAWQVYRSTSTSARSFS
jgi:peptidoglycan/LPS O-acetylase OafA/YrhL